MMKWSPRAMQTQLLAAVAVSCLVVGSMLATIAPALACTCPSGPYGYVSWPLDGATDAAIDTPIVVQLVDHVGDPGKIGISLHADDAAEVELVEVERVPPSYAGCGSAEAVFLRPVGRLQPGAMYEVRFSTGSTEQTGAKFRVGERPFEPEPRVDAAASYSAFYTSRECAAQGCPTVAHVQVELGMPPEGLRWLFVESSASRSGKNHWSFRPGAAPTAKLSVMQAADDPCVSVRIFGVEGRALFERRLCKAERCALCQVWAGSTCGAPSSCALEDTHRASRSCETPMSTSVSDAGASGVGPNADKQDASASSDVTDAPGSHEHEGNPSRVRGLAGGCSVRGVANNHSGAPLLLLALVLFGARYRRLGV